MKSNSPEDPSSFLSDALLTTRFEAGDYFHRWVGISAWLLLVVYEGEDVEFDGIDPSDWAYWHLGENMEPHELRDYLESEIFPSLERLGGTGHPLALVPDALRSVPDGPLMSTLQRAKDCYEPGSTPPLDELYPIWERWENASVPSMERGSGMIPLNLSCFLSKTLAATPDNRVADLHARTGTLGGEIFESSKHLKELVLFEQNRPLAVIAAMRAILRGQPLSKLQVRVCSPWNVSDKQKSKFDVVVAVPPWGAVMADQNGKRNRTRSEQLYAEAAMDMLAVGGRAAIVLPHSFLFSDTSRELRKRLINEFRLDLVVNVPGKSIFKADVKGAILYFSRKPAKDDVWMVGEDEYQLINPDGFSDTPEFESLEAAILARQGLYPQLKDENERPVDFDKWLQLRLADLNSEENPEGFLPGSPEHRLLRTAGLFKDGQALSVLPETGSLVSIESIQKRGFELIPPKGSASDYETFISLASEKFGAKLLRVSDIAEIRRGRHYRPQDLVEGLPFLENQVSVIRPSDVSKSFSKSPWINHGRVNLVPESASSVRQEDLLQDDDIVVCLVGAAGKANLCKPGALMVSQPKIVASDRLAIIRIRQECLTDVSPYLLASLLGTGPYRETLLFHSRGSTVRQLRVSDLRDLVVPIFPAAERFRLASAFDQDEAPLAALISALEFKPHSNAAIHFFTSDPEWRLFSELPPEASPSEIRIKLMKLVAKYESMIQTQAGGYEDAFLQWMALYLSAAKDLDEILDYSRGTDQLAALQGWRMSVKDPSRPFRAAWNQFLKSIYEDSDLVKKSVIARCERLFSRLIALSTMSGDALLDDVQVRVSMEPSILPASVSTECTLTVFNNGPLPLRKLHLSGNGIEGRVFPILPSGGNHASSVSLGPLSPGRHILNIMWNAICLDERPVGSAVELALEIIDQSKIAESEDLGESPYVFARVLDERTENVFFGRKKATQQILAAVSRAESSTIVLVEGNRRIGKTSLLKHFIRHSLPAGKVPVFINFQEFEGESGANSRPGIPTVKVFEGMVRKLVEAALEVCPNLELPDMGKAPSGNPFRIKTYVDKCASLIREDSPFGSFQNVAELVMSQIAPKKLLLILDEFDRLQEGIESGITSDQVPENLRHLFQSWNDLSGIFTGSRSIRRLREDYWNILFGLGEKVRLSGLEPEEARDLVELPVKGRMVYTPQAVEEICRLTSRQPLLIQGICEQLFRFCKETGRRSIELSIVESIAPRFVLESEHFESIWNYIGSDRKRLLTMLIDRNEAATGGLTFEFLLELLEECGLRLTVRELHSDLDDLEDLEVVSKLVDSGIAKYRIEVPLFSIWLRGAKDFNEFRAAALEE